jgi:hypothetical protein
LTAYLALAASILAGDVVDRIAATVDTSTISLSETRIQAKVAALIDARPPAIDAKALREAAERLVEQTILKREMAFTDFSPPPPSSGATLLADLKRSRFHSSEAEYRAALAEYGVSEDDLLAQLLWQITVLRFIDFRFRPGIQVSPADIRDYYQRKFTADWREATANPLPPLGQVRERIEAILAQEQLDAAVERWLNQTRTQLKIRFREEAFQ